MIKSSIFTGLVLALIATGCGKDEGGGGGGAAETVTVEGMSIKIDVPKGANQSSLGDSVMIQAPGLTISVGPAPSSTPAELAVAQKEATSMYSAKNMKGEAMKGGYWMTFDNKGGMGANFFVQMRVELGGKVYSCSTTAPEKAMQTKALAACKTLRE